MFERLAANLNYFLAMALFAVGLYIMLAHGNLIKKIIGLNIMETAVFLLIIALGYVRDAQPPIDATLPAANYANPLPSALVLTGIVIAVSVTAYGLSLAIRLHEKLGTIDADEIARRARDA